MNSFSKVLLAVFLLAALGGQAPVRAADPFPAGHYQFEVLLGPVLLDGRYSFTVDNMPGGELNVAPTETGKLAGTMSLWEKTATVTGTITTRSTFVRMVLIAKLDKTTFIVSANLKNGQFVGTLTTRGKRMPFVLDASTAGPMLGQYDADITVDSRGHLGGTANLHVPRHDVPLQVRGVANKRVVSLTLSTRGVLWRGTAAPGPKPGIIANYVAQGFGALRKGKALPVELVP